MTSERVALHAQVERWGAEAKRLADSGREVAALDLYRKAADALPGAPWLQHRTAELARKLRQSELAISYFRRSASAFVAAGFPKRAVAPLRAAWSIAREGVPRNVEVFLEISRELARLQHELGFLADSTVTVEYANDALRKAGLRARIELQDQPRESAIVPGPANTNDESSDQRARRNG